MTRRRHMRARGLTLLETVFAVVLMTLIAAAMFNTIDFLLSRQIAFERRLAAMELANRLMLQYLDDPTELKDDGGLPIRYHDAENADLFRWEKSESPVKIELDKAALKVEDQPTFVAHKLKYVTMRVWLAEQSGGSYRPEGSPVVAELSRLVDPAAMRTPEQVMKIFNNLDRIQDIIEDVGGTR